MKLHVNKETKQIEGYTLSGNIIDDKYDFIEVDLTENDITEDLFFSKYIDSEIVLDEDLKTSTQNKELIRELRTQRELECFPIINRGQLWYDELTNTQSTELRKWYFDWLDVTETKVIPEKPSWLE